MAVATNNRWVVQRAPPRTEKLGGAFLKQKDRKDELQVEYFCCQVSDSWK